MDKKLTSFKIAIKNILYHKKRSISLLILITMLSYIVFSSLIFQGNLKNGFDCMKNRLGADLIVVPIENENDMENILLQGSPSEFYFDKKLENQLSEIDGIEQITSQFYLQSLNASCCTSPIQLIGFNPDTDFSIKPWIEEVCVDEIKDGNVIVGSDVLLNSDNTITIFGRTYKIAAILEKTGSGTDFSVYSNKNTIKTMYQDLLNKDIKNKKIGNPDEEISSILIRLDENANKDNIINEIYEKFDNIKVIESNNLTQSISNSLLNICNIINLFITIFIICTFIMLYIVFILSINERKKEFAILRILGSTQSKVTNILLLESYFISLIGGVIGIILGLITMIPFNIYIGDMLNLPYVFVNNITLIEVMILILVISTLIGPIASINSIKQISKSEIISNNQ